MSAFADEQSQNGESQINFSTVRIVDGARSFIRALQRVFGAGLVLSAFLLWLAPGSTWAADLALFKLTTSLALGFSGLALWQVGVSASRFDIELDTEAREVRLVRCQNARMTVVLRCRFADLSRVEQEGDTLRLWDSSGTYLAEVEMCDAAMRKKLMDAMKSVGHTA
jgi:hypothetical protein